MRIFFVVHGFPPEQPGVWTYHHVHELAKRHEVCVFVWSPDGAKAYFEQRLEHDGQVLVWRWNNPFGDNLHGIANTHLDQLFEKALRYFMPDVIHFEHLIGLSAGMLAVAAKVGVPSILALYDYFFVCPRVHLIRGDHSLCDGPSHQFDCVTCMNEGHPIVQPLRRNAAMSRHVVPWNIQLHDHRLNFLRALIDYPDVLTACSDSLNDDLTRMLDLPANRIRTVSLGVPPLRSALPHSTSERLRVRYLGVVAPHKGVHILAQAAAALANQAVEFHLHGHAQSAYLAQLQQTYPALLHHGSYDSDRLPEILRETDILVLPTLSRETFSFVIREAALARVPVIASRFGAIPEYILHGENGWLVRPGSVDDLTEALHVLLGDAAFRERLAANARPIRSVEEYSAEMESVYRSLSSSASAASSSDRRDRPALNNLALLRQELGERGINVYSREDVSARQLETIAWLQQSLAEHQAVIAEQSASMSWLRDVAAGREATIAAQDEGIAWLRATLDEREATITAQEEGIAWLRKAIDKGVDADNTRSD